jgi:hypothetical protein
MNDAASLTRKSTTAAISSGCPHYGSDRRPIMSAVPFDTHAVVKELKAAGFADDQAEAVTRLVRNAQAVDLSRACRQLSHTTLATSWTAARKLRAVFS